MNKKLYLTLLSATILTLSMIPQFSTSASSPPTIYLDPSDYTFTTDTVTLGYKFNVTIRVTDLEKLMMFQVYITFNDSIINVTQVDSYAKAWPNDLLGGRAWDPEYVFYNKAGGMIGNPTYYHLGPGQGAVKIGDTLFSDATLDPATPYKLACIEFNVTALPPPGETLNCTLGIDNPDTYLYTSTGPIPDVTKENGYYELASPTAPPPPPPPAATTLKVIPPEIIDPTMLPSSTFSINITVEAVENLTVCQFNLTYNTEVLDIFGINFHKVLGQAPKPKIISDDEAGYVWIKLTYTTPITTSDSVPLVSIEFHVAALGASPLDLKDTELLDDKAQPIPHEAEDGFFCTLIRDVAVVNVVPSRKWVYQGRLVNITVTVENKGMINETFQVRTLYDSNVIESVTIQELPPGNETAFTVVWNTENVSACYNYTISAEAETVPYEFNLTDNTYINGFVKIRFLGDANGDDKVDMIDLYVVTQAFGSYPDHPRWNPDADMDQNNLIDMRDLYLTSINFGKGCSP